MKFLRSAPGNDPLELESEFNAPVERVFRAWVEPGELVKWFGGAPNTVLEADVDLRDGGQWRFILRDDDDGRAYFAGQYVTIRQPEQLVFTWSYVDEKRGRAPEVKHRSRVTVSFEALGDSRTRLRLHHAGLSSEEAIHMFAGGWDRSLQVLETLY